MNSSEYTLIQQATFDERLRGLCCDGGINPSTITSDCSCVGVPGPFTGTVYFLNYPEPIISINPNFYAITNTTVSGVGVFGPYVVPTSAAPINFGISGGDISNIQFATITGLIPTSIIPAGVFNLYIYATAASSVNNVYLYYKLYYQDLSAAYSPVYIATSGIKYLDIPSIVTEYAIPCAVSETPIPANSSILIQLYAGSVAAGNTLRLYFSSGLPTRIYTTFINPIYINELWTQNGTSIYYNSGNVGIGISGPIAALGVSGAVDIIKDVSDNIPHIELIAKNVSVVGILEDVYRQAILTNGDTINAKRIYGNSSTGIKREFRRDETFCRDAINGGEDTLATISLMRAGTLTRYQRLDALYDGVAMGRGAASNTSTNTNVVALGTNAGTNAGNSTVAIGNGAGQTNMGANAIAIGINAGNSGQTGQGIAIGTGAGQTNMGANAIAIGINAGNSGQTGQGIAIGDSAGQNGQFTRSIAIGYRAGNLNQNVQSIAIGYQAAESTQGFGAVAIGDNAGKTTQANYGVAVGANAGSSTQASGACAFGIDAGQNTQGTVAVAIGAGAGRITQGERSVAIGNNAGSTNQSQQAVAIGELAGQTSQGIYSIAIGNSSGNNTIGTGAVAIGRNSGQTLLGNYAVALGYDAIASSVNATTNSIGIGLEALRLDARDNAIGIGVKANRRNAGAYSVVLGSYTSDISGSGTNSIAIGKNAVANGSTPNSITLNGTGTEITANQAGLFCDPIRGVAHGIGVGVLKYDPITKEITYSTT